MCVCGGGTTDVKKWKIFQSMDGGFFLFNNFFSDERFFYFVNPKHTCENTLKKRGQKNEANFVSLCLFVCCCFLLIKNDVVQQKKWNEVKWDAKKHKFDLSTLSVRLVVLLLQLDNNKLFVCIFFLVWSVKFCQDQREMMIIITIKIKSKEAKSKRHKSYTHTHWEKNISKFSHPFFVLHHHCYVWFPCFWLLWWCRWYLLFTAVRTTEFNL